MEPEKIGREQNWNIKRKNNVRNVILNPVKEDRKIGNNERKRIARSKIQQVIVHIKR